MVPKRREARRGAKTSGLYSGGLCLACASLSSFLFYVRLDRLHRIIRERIIFGYSAPRALPLWTGARGTHAAVRFAQILQPIATVQYSQRPDPSWKCGDGSLVSRRAAAAQRAGRRGEDHARCAARHPTRPLTRPVKMCQSLLTDTDHCHSHHRASRESRRFGVHSGATVGRHPRARRFRARSPTRARHTGDGRMGMLGHTAYLFLIRNRIPMKWRRKIDRVCASIACRRRGAHALPKDGDEAREAIARYYTHTRRRGRETRRVGRECFAGNADINLPRRSCPLRSCHSVHAARSMCST